MNAERVVGAVAEVDVARLDLRAVRESWAAVRAEYGFTPFGPPPSLLGPPSSNVKLGKASPVPIYGLTLAPAESAGLGVTVCPWASRGPGGRAALCTVGEGARGSWDVVRAGRSARTAFLLADPVGFLGLLDLELERLGARHRRGFAVRLNVGSDVRWERVAPWLFGRHGRGFGGRAIFYDYSKAPMAARSTAAGMGYDLTYSARRASAAEDRRLCSVLDAGGRVAIVFAGERPTSWEGWPVIDGERTDARWADPAGVVVGLRAKGAAIGAPVGVGFVRRQ